MYRMAVTGRCQFNAKVILVLVPIDGDHFRPLEFLAGEAHLIIVKYAMYTVTSPHARGSQNERDGLPGRPGLPLNIICKIPQAER
jgi:hypothetical protein